MLWQRLGVLKIKSHRNATASCLPYYEVRGFIDVKLTAARNADTNTHMPNTGSVRRIAHLSAGSANTHCDCKREKDEGASGSSCPSISSSLTTKNVYEKTSSTQGQSVVETRM